MRQNHFSGVPMPQLLFPLWLFVFCCCCLMMMTGTVCGNELSRCCAGGARHHREHGNCHAVRAVGSTPTCARAGSICCLRALIDSHCQAGLMYAQRHKVCSTVIINELAGGIKRECCDCCLLARELSENGQQCVAPTGFSPDCLNAFNKCCNHTGETAGGNHHQSAAQHASGISSVTVPIGDDGTAGGSTCATANCEHLCTTREDDSPQCSCRSGFDLAPDGRTCVDIDECDVLQAHWNRRKAARSATTHRDAAQMAQTTQALLQLLPAIFRGMPLCDMSREICVNTEGGFGCRPATSSGSGGGSAISNPAKLVARQPPLDKSDGNRKAMAVAGRRRQNAATSNARPNSRKKMLDKQMPRRKNAKMRDDVGGGGNVGANAVNVNEEEAARRRLAYQMVNSDAIHPQKMPMMGNAGKNQTVTRTIEAAVMAGKLSTTKTKTTTKPASTVSDVDECTLGAHDCGPMYQCRNTQGSFRCVPKRCAPDQLLDPSTGECKSVNCPPGYRAHEGRCEDIDECKEQQPRRCSTYEECVNTPGSYRCQEQGNVCTSGYYLDKESGFCLDVDECQRGTHTCAPHGECMNLAGSFRCKCDAGFEFNEYTMRCEDINECVKFAGHACSLQADCVNTVGSHQCICRAGFKLAADNRTCDDIDECVSGVARCQQKCINSPGSYQCICDRGYQLGIDESTCEDIDECEIWSKSGNDLCMGKCINTPGSFMCTCPIGYQIQADGITCKDIDECAQQPLICPADQLCINLLGSYRCQRVECPRNYLPDRQYKNRCVKKPGFCANLLIERCRKHPIHISWQHIAIPKQINISMHRTSVTLFSMKGPTNLTSNMQFELRMVEAKTDFDTVTPAVRSNFLLQKGDNHNSATIALRDSLDGPQQVHLELTLRLTTNGAFSGKYIANLMVYVSQYRPQQPQHDRHHHHRHRQHRDFHI